MIITQHQLKINEILHRNSSGIDKYEILSSLKINRTHQLLSLYIIHKLA